VAPLQGGTHELSPENDSWERSPESLDSGAHQPMRSRRASPFASRWIDRGLGCVWAAWLLVAVGVILFGLISTFEAVGAGIAILLLEIGAYSAFKLWRRDGGHRLFSTDLGLAVLAVLAVAAAVWLLTHLNKL
jgi:hypothetical protein